MTKPAAPESFSIAIRVRRVTYEDAYVAVPVTDKLMQKKPDGTLQLAPDGTAHIDPDVLVAEAIRISQDQRVEWKIESSKTEPHPTQQPLPKDRKSFDAIIDLVPNK